MSEKASTHPHNKDNDKLQHRKQQLLNILSLIESVQSELQTAISHNKVLNKKKSDLEEELITYDIRLKSILKEKEYLFSRLMTVERDIGKLEA